MLKLTALIVTLLAGAGCLYEPQYAQLTCTSDGDCSGGARCVERVCVAGDEPPPDAGDASSPDAAPTIATVAIEPAQVDLVLGMTRQLTATATDSDGNAVETTFTWSSSDDTTVDVNASGLVAALRPGTADVFAEAGGVRGTTSVTVGAPVDAVTVDPATLTLGQGVRAMLVATATDADGNVLQGREIAWASSDAATVEVLEDGTITALLEGAATVTATAEGKSGAAVVTVEPNAVVAVALEPDEPTIDIGEIRTYDAVIRDANDNVLDPRNRAFAWSLSNMANATLIDIMVPWQRRVHAQQLGMVTLSVDVDAGAAADELVLEVVLPVVDSVTILDPGVLAVGATPTLQTTVLDPDGDPILDRPHVWTSSDPAVAMIDAATGQMKAIAPGATTISVDVDGVMATRDVTVLFLLTKISAGALHTCGVSPDNVGFCWGDNNSGRLGIGPLPNTSTPTEVLAPGLVDVEAGGPVSCARDVAGDVLCWGASGLTGSADGAATNTPRSIATGLQYTALDVGEFHACAIDSAGLVWCWGRGGDGQLGHDETNDEDAPVQVDFTPVGTPTALALGRRHSCVLTDASAVWCWGEGNDGQLGNDDTSDSDVPVPVSTAVAFESIAAGGTVTCGRTAANAVYCWGGNASGELGIGDLAVGSAAIPTVLPNVSFSALDVGWEHGCGLDAATGEVRCWGRPDNHRLGVMDDVTVRPAPVPNAGNLLAEAVSGGDQHSCAIATDGRAYCWGSNGAGRSGTGAGMLEVPTLVWP